MAARDNRQKGGEGFRTHLMHFPENVQAGGFLRLHNFFLASLSFLPAHRLISKLNSLKEQFLILVQENEGILLKVCRMYADRREDREDLFQEIVLQLWRSFPGYKGEAKISTWMYRVALNTAITHLRKETRRAKSTQLDEVALQVPAGLDPEPEEKVEAMYRAIQQLTAVEKALVMLYMDDHSYRSITEIMGISESNVGFKLNKIKTKLRNLVKTK